MKAYDFLGIIVGSGGDIDVVSTDENTVEWITEQIKTKTSTAEIFTEPEEVPQIKNMRRRFYKLNYKQFSISVWLVQQLCQDGWEPFGNIDFSRSSGFHRMTLRRTREEESIS